MIFNQMAIKRQVASLAIIKTAALILLVLSFSCASIVKQEKRALTESKEITRIQLNRKAFLLDSIYDNRISVYYVSKMPDSVYLERWNDEKKVKLMAKGIKNISEKERDYLFGAENVEYYKQQLNDFDLEFITNEVFENDKLKPYRKKKDNRIDGFLSRRIIMSSPVFTKDDKYALFYSASGGGAIFIVIYKKSNSNNWKSYRSAPYLVFDPIINNN